MTDLHEHRDAELGRMIETISVPPLSADFFTRTAQAASADSPPAASRLRRARPIWRLVAAAAAIAAAAALAGGFVGASLTHAPARAGASQASVMGFLPASGWNSVVAPLPSKLKANNQVTWASDVPFQGDDLASGWPNATVKLLPPDGVVIFASLAHISSPGGFTERSAPLKLADGNFFSSHFDGQPAPNVSLQLIEAHINGQYVLIQVWFGRLEPSDEQKRKADAELARLQIPVQ